MKITKQLLIDKGFEFDEEMKSLIRHKEDETLQIILNKENFYPVLWQKYFSKGHSERVVLKKITELEELETIWKLLTGGVL